MWIKAFVLWILMAFLAVGNGVVRNFLITPYLGDPAAHWLGTLTALILLFGAMYLILPWVGPRTRGHLWGIGLFWLILTMAFEFLAGHYLFGNPWDKLLADYNLIRGRVWVTVLLLQLFGPLGVAKVKGIPLR